MRKFLFIIICCVSATWLTSCYYDSEDEYHEITPQEIGQCLTAVKGNYSGKLLFEVNNPKDRSDYLDTLDIAWSVTADTMFNVKEFPQAVFLDRIADPELKEAVEQAAPAPLLALQKLPRARASKPHQMPDCIPYSKPTMASITL